MQIVIKDISEKIYAEVWLKNQKPTFCGSIPVCEFEQELKIESFSSTFTHLFKPIQNKYFRNSYGL